MIDALLMFGQQEHIGIGIEYIDVAAFEQRITLQLADTNVRNVLDAITRPVGCRWSTDGRVITVTHVGALTGNKNLLNKRIPKFKLPETSLGSADCTLSIFFYFVMNPNSKGLAGDCMSSAQAVRVGPIEMKNATVRQILNRMVSQHGSAAWVVQQPPWTMGKDLGYGFWNVLAYDVPDGHYSKRLLVRGLGL